MSRIDLLRKNYQRICGMQWDRHVAGPQRVWLAVYDKEDERKLRVWVSGFFGSGKSHLVKMLQYLWLDFAFPDGARARGLAKLPTNVKDLLKELSTAAAAKRMGGLHAAAGTLGAGAGDSVRLELLGIVPRGSQ